MSYISHKMEELQQIADRVVVLRDGKTIGPVTPIPEITLDQLISRMVGRDVKDMFPKGQFQRGEKVLEVKNFEIDNPDLPGQKKVKNASFCAYKGEILGFSGLMGSGAPSWSRVFLGHRPGRRVAKSTWITNWCISARPTPPSKRVLVWSPRTASGSG
jgi:D-xylose transport system ATP-binding protein